MPREGFWWTGDGSLLPKPTPSDKPWEGKKKFLDALYKAEKKAKVTHYKGFSDCRICNRSNGRSEFTYQDWTWPVGLRHYIAHHNVRPSLAFQEFILNEELE
jgi:hypothetical protein